MDSPTLISFNYEQFWLEERLRLEFNLSEPALSIVPSSVETETPSVKSEETSSAAPKKKRAPTKNDTSENYRATKNLAKNYGKAIASFASSGLATTYLVPILQKERLSLSDFLSYMKAAKESIQGIDSFRNFLLVNASDSALVVAQKRAFQAMGIIFVKYFSVNWIMHGRLGNKIVYLKNRFKILRRIQDPASFTYLQGPKAKKEGKGKKE